MSSSKKSLSYLLFAAAGVALLVGPAGAVSPSVLNGLTSVPDHGVVKNDIPFANGNDDVGWKVWVATDTAPRQVTDELGNVVTQGILRTICLSSGPTSEWAVAYDSGTSSNGFTTANQPSNVGLQLTDVVNRSSTTAAYCLPTVFAQFNNGLWTLLSGTNGGGAGTAHFYWRPAKGGRN